MDCQLQLTDQLVAHWKVGDASVAFVLEAAQGTDPRYLALGLGSEMDQSRVVVGFLQDGDVPAAKAYLLPKYTSPAEDSCATASQVRWLLRQAPAHANRSSTSAKIWLLEHVECGGDVASR